MCGGTVHGLCLGLRPPRPAPEATINTFQLRWAIAGPSTPPQRCRPPRGHVPEHGLGGEDVVQRPIRRRRADASGRLQGLEDAFGG